MSTPASLIEELERTLASGTNDQRTQALARITDLFVASAGRYSAEQIGLFDDVILRIAARIEAKTLAKLSSRLATVPNAPAKVMKQLAFHDDIAVARPVLSLSDRLDDNDLVVNAKTKGQQHLLAISERKAISEIVTDILVERGNKDVVRSVAKNSGARFSDAGFRVLVNRSNGDDVLATHVGMRRDIPRQHFLVLIDQASASVRDKLTASNPKAALAVKDVVAEVVGGLRSEVRNASPTYAAAKAEVDALHRAGRLDEAQIYQFARDRKFEETAISLSLVCGIEPDAVERALLDQGSEISLILAKFADLSWTTAKAILLLQAADRGMSAQDLDQAMRNFGRLQPETARRVIGFYRTRRKLLGDHTAPLPVAAEG
jgi:uncharacterized protein (DUF2336 family)